MGARVIKVKGDSGDFARTYDETVHGDSSFFVWLNRTKEFVVIDLKNEEGRQARVKVTLADGSVISRFSDAFVGSASKRATWGQIQDKAASLVGQERARQLAEHARSQALETKASMAGESVLVG